jgi:hypothetical protein
MKKLILAACTGLGALGSVRAVDKVGPLVPAYDVTDKYVTSSTMLVRAGADGLIREIWAGMDAGRMRHLPLFLETSIHGEIRKGAGWMDLRSLRYRNEGTRPGYVRIVSEDGSVRIEITARTKAALSPIFVRTTFSSPVDYRLTARFQRPEASRTGRADDASGSAVFSTAWRGENSALTPSEGPNLVLATQPAGRTESVDGTGTVKEIDGVKDVLLCIDATEHDPRGPEGGSYAGAWVGTLGGTRDAEAELDRDHVTLASDDPKLDHLFEDSIDAITSHQFASGDLFADLYFYRDSWIRDGSYTMIGLSLAGDTSDVDRFFAYWDANRDAYVGGEREAQQPAIAVTAMWLHSRLHPAGRDFLKTHWSYVRDTCNHFVERINSEGMVNVAEEWICFIPCPATWPNAEIYSGLRAGAKIAGELGRSEQERAWTAAADRLKKAFDAVAYDGAAGKFIPMAGKPGEIFRDEEYPNAENRNGPTRDDRTDSGMLMLARLEAFGRGQGIVAVDDPRFLSTQEAIRRDLENPDHSIYRFGPNPTSPHAPQGELDTWPINTGWAAQDSWLQGRTDLAWRYLLSGEVNKAGVDLAKACDYLPENWDKGGVADKPIIVWSHGELVTTTLLLFLGFDLEPQGADLGLAPSLPPGMNHAHLSGFRFRNWSLDIDLRRRGDLVSVSIVPAAAGSDRERSEALSIRIPSGELLECRDGAKVAFSVDPSQYPAEFGLLRRPVAD